MNPRYFLTILALLFVTCVVLTLGSDNDCRAVVAPSDAGWSITGGVAPWHFVDRADATVNVDDYLALSCK